VALVGVVHELYNETFRWVTPEHFRALDSVVFVSEASSRTFSPDRFAPGVPRRTVYNWLTAGERAKLDAPATRYTTGVSTILMCGAVAHHKRQLHGARAFARIALDRPELHLLVLGTVYDRNYADKILETVQRGAGAGRVTIAGAVSHETVLSEMRAATAVLHCACMESCCLVIMEAMAAGAPVIAAAAGGVPEQITDGRDGLLYEPGGVDEEERIAALLLSVLDDRVRAAALGGSARERVLGSGTGRGVTSVRAAGPYCEATCVEAYVEVMEAAVRCGHKTLKP
jgi:glycosyltransferase involved in cell wall biosynthesis